MIQTILALFLLGGIAGTLGDFSHVLSGTLGYPEYPIMLPGGQPYWVPLLFGSATLAIGLSHPWADTWLGKQKKRRFTLNQVVLAALSFLILYGISGFLPFPTGGLRDAILLLGAAVIWFSFDRTWQGLVLGTCTAILGTGVELFLTHSDIFYYTPEQANFHGVASWLPWLYIAASVAGGNAGRFLVSHYGVLRKRAN